MYITAYFTNNGTPATGLSATIRIRDLSDDSLAVTDAAMSEVGEGYYKYNFSTYDETKDYAIRCDGGVTLSGYDRYTFGTNRDDLEISGKLPTNYFMGSSDGSDKDDEIDAIKAKTDNLPADADDVLSRILGLVHHNIYTVATWTGDNMTGSTIEIYDTAAHATTHDGSTGLIGKYTLTVTYSGSQAQTILMVKVS